MLTFRFIGRYWKKRPSSSSWRWKNFWNFGFNRMGLRHTRLIWPWIWLKLTSRSASFRTVFCPKKGAVAGCRTAPISVLWPVSFIEHCSQSIEHPHLHGQYYEGLIILSIILNLDIEHKGYTYPIHVLRAYWICVLSGELGLNKIHLENLWFAQKFEINTTMLTVWKLLRRCEWVSTSHQWWNTVCFTEKRMLRQNHAYTNYRRIGENRPIPNIRQHSKFMRNRENWLSHRVFANIRLFRKFGCAENVFGTWQILRMYKYIDLHITYLSILAQCSWLFSKNECTCSSAFTMPPVTSLVCKGSP